MLRHVRYKRESWYYDLKQGWFIDNYWNCVHLYHKPVNWNREGVYVFLLICTLIYIYLYLSLHCALLCIWLLGCIRAFTDLNNNKLYNNNNNNNNNNDNNKMAADCKLIKMTENDRIAYGGKESAAP